MTFRPVAGPVTLDAVLVRKLRYLNFHRRLDARRAAARRHSYATAHQSRKLSWQQNGWLQSVVRIKIALCQSTAIVA